MFGASPALPHGGRQTPATAFIGCYVLYNLTYVLSTWPLGHLADRLSPRRLLVACFLVFAGVYGGMALATHTGVIVALFAVYGLYAAATEGIGKAWVSTLCAKADAGAALGTLRGLSSLAALGASAFAGLLWQWQGPALPFGLAAIVAIGVACYLARVRLRTAMPG